MHNTRWQQKGEIEESAATFDFCRVSFLKFVKSSFQGLISRNDLIFYYSFQWLVNEAFVLHVWYGPEAPTDGTSSCSFPIMNIENDHDHDHESECKNNTF